MPGDHRHGGTVGGEQKKLGVVGSAEVFQQIADHAQALLDPGSDPSQMFEFALEVLDQTAVEHLLDFQQTGQHRRDPRRHRHQALQIRLGEPPLAGRGGDVDDA